MNATEFLAELKKLNITGRDFLALVGHTDMSNETYSEIKENPAMTYERLVELLDSSPISESDYLRLLNTARSRSQTRAIKENRQKRDELERQLGDILAQGLPPKPFEPPPEPEPLQPELFPTEEIKIVSDRDFSEYESAESDSDSIWTITDDNCEQQRAKLADFSEFGGLDDFDDNAPRENRTRLLVSIALGLIVAFTSFFMRYITTGAWGVHDFVYLPPQSYEELFELRQSQRVQPAMSLQSQSLPQYRTDEGLSAVSTPLVHVTSNEGYLFKVRGNAISAVGISAGIMSHAPAFEPDDDAGVIEGIFVHGGRLFAVYNDIRRYTVYYEEEGAREKLSLAFSQVQTIVYEFDAFVFTGVPLAIHKFDGFLREIVLYSDTSFAIIADYSP
ncbi:MAG: hypothetical protein FWD35_02885, partial [Oscillospiraceae bacterium]|nr:hypothetical protein [Oscillospiraceae bacterium]